MIMLHRVVPCRPEKPKAAPGGLLDGASQGDTVMIPVQLCNLPPFPAVARQLLALQDSPDLDPRRVTALVGADPALAAEVLFLANSSLFGFPSRIQVLHHAVALLGVDRVRALAMTVAARALMANGGQPARQCWRHSAACAILAAEMAGATETSSNAAYTAGLLHDLGRLGLLRSYAREATAVLSQEYEDTEDVLRAEREAFQVDHGVAGSWLVGYWSFPNVFLEICERHHEAPGEQDSPMLRIVKLACRLADALGYTAVNCKRGPDFEEVLSYQPGLVCFLPAQDVLRASVEERLAALQQ